MNLNSTVAVAVRRALMVGAISTSVVAPVFAQESASAGAELETIVVTGSRLKQANLESSSPVTQVTAADVATQGVTRVEDLINQLPQLVWRQLDRGHHLQQYLAIHISLLVFFLNNSGQQIRVETISQTFQSDPGRPGGREQLRHQRRTIRAEGTEM